MTANDIAIRFDGGDADRNAIDAKLLGQSLQGFDRLVSDCVIIFSYERLPKRGERSPLILKVYEPRAGSYGLPAIYQEVASHLALGVPIITAIGPDIISHYIQTVIDYFRGKGDSLEHAISRMAEMHQAALAAMTEGQRNVLDAMGEADEHRHEEAIGVERNRHAEAMGMQDLLRLAITSSGAAAVDLVAPIGQGRSVSQASFKSGTGPEVVVGTEDSEAIRDSQKMEWRDPQIERLKTDGFKFHSNTLSVQNPERDGYMMADVVDPTFEEEANSYTMAAQRRAVIEVLARKGYRGGVLTKIQILHFLNELDEENA